MNPKPYTNPYVAGVGIGLVLLASYVIVGRGLGAIGAFSSAVAAAVGTVAPEHAAQNAVHGGYLARGGILRDWLFLEIVGVTIGGFVSAWLAGRFAPTMTVETAGFLSSHASATCATVQPCFCATSRMTSITS